MHQSPRHLRQKCAHRENKMEINFHRSWLNRSLPGRNRSTPVRAWFRLAGWLERILSRRIQSGSVPARGRIDQRRAGLPSGCTSSTASRRATSPNISARSEWHGGAIWNFGIEQVFYSWFLDNRWNWSELHLEPNLNCEFLVYSLWLHANRIFCKLVSFDTPN